MPVSLSVTDVDVNILYTAFIHPSSVTLPPCTTPVSSELEPFSAEGIFNNASSVGPDSLCISPVKSRPISLSYFMDALVNNSSVAGVVLAQWKTSTVVPIPRHTNSDISSKLPAPKLPGLAVLSRLRSLFAFTNYLFHSKCKPNRCALNTVASIWHLVPKCLNTSMKSVRQFFLDYCAAFESVSIFIFSLSFSLSDGSVPHYYGLQATFSIELNQPWLVFNYLFSYLPTPMFFKELFHFILSLVTSVICLLINIFHFSAMPMGSYSFSKRPISLTLHLSQEICA